MDENKELRSGHREKIASKSDKSEVLFLHTILDVCFDT